MELPYEDCAAASRALAAAVRARGWDRPSLLVYGLAWGGMPVAAETARALSKPLEVILVRKLGVPGQQELAIGAIASGGFEVLNEDLLALLGVDETALTRVRRAEQAVLERRAHWYRESRAPLDPAGHPVLLMDDGAAAGAGMVVAARACLAASPGRQGGVS